ASAALLFWLWPWRTALQHLALLGLLGAVIAELSLHGFQKIPFTCSYLPGKTHFNMALVYLVLFLFATERGADLEMRALREPATYAIMLLILGAAAIVARWRTAARANSEGEGLLFEEAPVPAIFELGLHRDGILAVDVPRSN